MNAKQISSPTGVQTLFMFPGLVPAMHTVLAWGYFILVLIVFDPILRVAWLFGQWTLHMSASVMCRFLHGVIYLTGSRLVVEGEEIPDPDRRYLILINHQSFLEGILPISLLQPLRPVFICKDELGGGIPAVSFFLRNGGHFLIERTDASQSLAALGMAGRKLEAQEVSPVFFPEGTRSFDGRLLRFKRAGLTQILDRSPQAQILPVLIDGGFALFPKGFGWVRPHTTVRMRILPPMQKGEQDASDFIKSVEEQLRAELDRLRADPR